MLLRYCSNVDKLAETNKKVYLFQHYPPSILLQCWQTCRNKQGCVSAPTLSSFHLAAMLANLQKQTKVYTCSKIIPLPSCYNVGNLQKQTRVYTCSNIFHLPTCCNVGKLAETNKDVYLLQNYPTSFLLQCWQTCRNKQDCVSVPTLSSLHLAAMLENLQKQTSTCFCSNIIFLSSCCNVGKLAETNKRVYLFQHYPPSILLQCWQICRNKQGCVSLPTLSSFHLSAMLTNLQKQTRMCFGSHINLLPSCCNVGKLTETNRDVYLHLHYPPSILQQCWQICRSKQESVPTPTLSSFHLAAILANLQKQTTMYICSNIILHPFRYNVGKLAETNKHVFLHEHYIPSILLQCWKTCREKQGCASAPTLSSFHLAAKLENLQKPTRMCICSNIILFSSCCNVGKLAVTNKGVYQLQNYLPSILLQCWQTCINKQGCVPAPTLCSFDLTAMLTNLQKQTRKCICSNINLLLSCCNFGKLAETNKGVYMLQHYPPSNSLQCWKTCRNKQDCVSVPTLSSFDLAAMLVNLQ